MIARHLCRLLTWAAACLIATADAARAEPAQLEITPDCRLQAGPTHAVSRVLDGETLTLDDGSEVRLIGALAPRAHDVGAADNEWPPASDAKGALEDIVLGRSVALGFAGRRKDRYGRWLAHVLVERDGGSRWVQAEMLDRGMARAYGLPGSDACMTDLVAHERQAREANRGLWINAAYQVRDAGRPRELLAYRHTFQLVTGKITTTASTRGRIYLHFAGGRKPAFSVVVKHANALPMGAGAQTLQGRSVLVRGWIDRRWGPIIEVDGAGQISLTDGSERAPVTGQIAR